jgi:HNH endonuclease
MSQRKTRSSYVSQMTDQDRERFESKFEKTKGCWLWKAGISVYGYGWFRPHSTMECCNAHRISYEMYVGPILNDLTVHHLCKEKCCVNPMHLELLSRAEHGRRDNPPKLVCIRGHAFTAPNTFTGSDGRQTCKQCYRIRTGWNLISSGPGPQKAAIR